MRRPLQVLVVAYGDDLEGLSRALSSVHDQHVLVIDNGRSTAVAALAASAGADYLISPGNIGFGSGVNAGLELLRSRGELPDVLLLNPDAELLPGCLSALVTALDEDPSLACVSPSVVDADGQLQRVSWPWPSPRSTWRIALGRPARGGGFVIGAVLLLRGAAVDEVGGFDPRFFLYAEEADWQRRAVLAGWRVREVTEVRAVHAGAGTSSDSVRREVLFHAGQETYIRKWFGARGWASYRLAVLMGSAARFVVLRGEDARAARQRLVLYARGPKRMAARSRS